MKKISLILLALLLCFGCAGHKFVTLATLKPAEINLSQIKKIAILDFQGVNGDLAANRFSSKLFATQQFEIMERTQLAKLQKESGLASLDLQDKELTKKIISRLKGIDALIFGKVETYEFKEEVTTTQVNRSKKVGTKTAYDQKGQPYEMAVYQNVLVNLPLVIRRGTISISYRVISVKTGELLAMKSDTQTYEGKSVIEEDGTGEYLPDEKTILDNLLNKVLDGFVSQIAPHYLTQTKEWESAGSLTDTAFKCFKAGLIKEAQDNLEQVLLKIDPQKTKKISIIYYDLGLAYEAGGELDKAEEMYKKAVDNNPSQLHLKALGNIRTVIDDQKKLAEQKKK